MAVMGTALFASKAVVIKWAYQFGYSPLELMGARMLFALPVYLIIAVICIKKQRDLFLTLSFKDWILLAYLGFSGYYLASLLDFIGLRYITASLERILVFSYPAMTAIIDSLVRRQVPSKNEIMAILICYGGIAITFSVDMTFSFSKNQQVLGTLLVLGSALSFSFYLVFTQGVLKKLGTSLFTSIVMIFSTGYLAIHLLFANEFPPLSETTMFGSGLVLAILCTIIPSFLVVKSIEMIGSTKVATIGNTGPLVTIGLAYFVLGEIITPVQVLGGMIIILGVSLLSEKKSKNN